MCIATLRVATIKQDAFPPKCIACFKGELGATVRYNTVQHNESGQCNFLRTHVYHRPFLSYADAHSHWV